MYPDFSAYVRQPDWVPLKAGWHYRVAIQVAVGLARGLSGRPLGFREIYLFLVDLFTAWVADLRSATGQPDGQAAHDGAWNMAVRIFKGTSGAPGAVYTKDIVYLEGTVRAWQLAAKRPEFIMLGDAGKFDISSEKHVTMLSKLGILQI